MTWKRPALVALALLAAAGVSAFWLTSASNAQSRAAAAMDPAVTANVRQMLDEGRRVFRYETFGDEAYWGETLKLHRAIAGARLAGARLGGVGPGVSPKTALSVELKVDVDAVPAPAKSCCSTDSLAARSMATCSSSSTPTPKHPGRA